MSNRRKISNNSSLGEGSLSSFGHSVDWDTQVNRESITLIWLDLESQSTSSFIGSLRVVNDCVRTYTDAAICLRDLEVSIHKNFLISTSSTDEFLAAVHCLENVEAIFLLHSDVIALKNDYPKCLGTFRQQEELIRALRDALEKYQKVQLEKFVFEHDEIFLWLQLWREEILPQKVAVSSKNNFIDTARVYYRSNVRRIRLIEEFQRTYRPKEAFRWCFNGPFPLYLVRHAFMSCQLEQLNLCRFLIADASRLIHQQPKKFNGSVQLYRGMKLSSKLLNLFEAHSGKVMCTLGFFTCTKSRTIALELALSPGYRPDLLSVLFKIDCDPSTKLAELSIDNSAPLITFDVGTTFRIMCVNRGAISIVKVKPEAIKGKEIARQYRNNHTRETVESLLDQLFTSAQPKLPTRTDSEVKQSDLQQQAMNHLKNGEIDVAISVLEQIRPVSTPILVQIGQIYADNKGDYENALKIFKQALKMQEETGDDIAETLTRIGSVYLERREYDLALQYHTRALKLRESSQPSDDAAIATSLMGISNAHRAQQELSEALQFAQRALSLREALVPSNEASVGASLATIATIHHELGDDSQALREGLQALSIFERVLPTKSPEWAALFNNLGAIQLSLGAISEAQQYFERSLQIYQQILPSQHPNLLILENNIRCIMEMQS